jgi:hypothetical protein
MSATCEALNPYGASHPESASVILWSHGTWTAPIADDGMVAADGACASATQCIVVGRQTPVEVSIFNGTSWSTPAVPTLGSPSAASQSSAASGSSPQSSIAFAALAVKVPATVLNVAAAATSLRVSCGSRRCTGSVSITEQVSQRVKVGTKTVSKTSTVVLASSSYAIGAKATAAVKLRLTTAGRKALAKLTAAHPLRETLTVVANGKRSSKAISLR